jgi:3-keto-5-aminohexanoate cleavage enzyme
MEKIPSPKPYLIDFPMGMHRSTQNVVSYSPKSLMYLVDQLPQDVVFVTMGVADAQTQAGAQSILLGGHARVGFEDNFYYSKGVMAQSNAELVKRMARIGTDLGRQIATPEEARQLLSIPSLRK